SSDVPLAAATLGHPPLDPGDLTFPPRPAFYFGMRRKGTEVMNQSDITWDVYESPIGPLMLIAGEAGLRGLWFPGKTPAPAEQLRAPLPAVTERLDAYFAGELRAFEVDLDMRGPELDREVWRRLLDIPYGRTESYGELAARVDPDLFGPGVEPWQRAR